MHSGRMRTAPSTSHPGGAPPAPPRAGTPRDQVPPGPGTPRAGTPPPPGPGTKRLILRRHLFYSQVAVHINEIPSRCDGDCSFQYMDGDTPQISGMNPSEGNDTNSLLTLHETGAEVGLGGAIRDNILELVDPIPPV